MRLAIGTSVLVALVGTVSPAEATLSAKSNRLAGTDRFTTAMQVAEATFDDAPVALLTDGGSYADGLSASYISGGLGAPMLLTDTDALPPRTIETLRRLGTQSVIVVGGFGVVSEAVEQDLESQGLVVNRISGNSRYETARLVAGTFASDSIGSIDGGRAAIVATGEGFADAMAIAPLSSSSGIPIVLTPRATLHPEARATLQEHDIKQVVVVGGSAAVSDAVVTQIKAMGIGVRRIAGPTRQDTALAIASFAAANLGYAMDRVLLARGDQFADALSAGTRGGRLRAPVLLVAGPRAIGDNVRAFLSEHVETLATVDVLGGEGVISEAVAEDAVQAARGR
jgi:putative cell wall-binding protein